MSNNNQMKKLLTLLIEVSDIESRQATIKTKVDRLKKIVMNTEKALEDLKDQVKEDQSSITQDINRVDDLNKRLTSLISKIQEYQSKGELDKADLTIRKAENYIAAESIKNKFLKDILRNVERSKTWRSSQDDTKNKKDNSHAIDKLEMYDDIKDDHFSSKEINSVLRLGVEAIINSNSTKEQKEQFIDAIKNTDNLITAEKISKSVDSGNIDSLLGDEITNSSIYKDVKSALLATSGRSERGGGEQFLVFFGKNSGPGKRTKNGDEKYDVIIDGKKIEVKSGAASIDSYIAGARKLNIDEYNKDILTSKPPNGFGLSIQDIKQINIRSSSQIKMDFSDPIIVKAIKATDSKLATAILTKYFTKIYGDKDKGLDKKDISDIVSYTIKNLGKETDIHKFIGQYVYKLYKKNKNFDTLFVFSKDGTRFTYSNQDSIPEDLMYKGSILSKGNSNQAVSVGQIVVMVPGEKDLSKTKEKKSKALKTQKEKDIIKPKPLEKDTELAKKLKVKRSDTISTGNGVYINTLALSKNKELENYLKGFIDKKSTINIPLGKSNSGNYVKINHPNIERI